MCGIAGLFGGPGGHSTQELNDIAKRMTQTLHHRGPDGGDVWVDGDHGLGLGHRRLAIIDLSEAGHQPMASSDGRFVIVYNGEVYNAQDLRPALEKMGHQFKGHSDTEVIVNGFSSWGVRATVEKLIGMFAIAAWDKQEKRLYLIRDRLGIKPLYWAETANGLLFGSEMKALYAHPDCPKTINRNAAASFLRHNYIPAPYTMFDHIHKLEAGHILSVDQTLDPKIEAFWSLNDWVSQDTFKGNDAEAIDQLEDLLKDAVKRRMIADVPLGAFLSGGIDSSLVAALMQNQSERPVRTFSIGFEEAGYNEAEHAKAVAAHLGTEHTELYVTPAEAREVIPKLAEFYDEPFSDSSQIPTYLVSKMTRDHVTVALSGDGGDELFGGYNRYFSADKMGRSLYKVPLPLRKLGASTIEAFSPSFWDKVFSLVPASKRPAQPGDKLYKLAGVMSGRPEDFYRRLISHWDSPNDIIKGASEYKGLVWDDSLKTRVSDFVERMQYLDTLTYLPDDILTKVDRASMAVSLEARVPLLDHRVVEMAWSLPKHLKIREGQGKWILRQVLYRHVPRELIERPKMGFGVPIDQWLRGPLKEWAGDLIHSHNELLNKQPILEKWDEHQKGSRNWQYHLWDIVMLQSWMDRWAR